MDHFLMALTGVAASIHRVFSSLRTVPGEGMLRGDYAYQRLGAAMYHLTNRTRPLRDRVQSASVCCIGLTSQDFREGDLRNRWIEVNRRLTRASAGESGSLSLTDREVEELAVLIRELWAAFRATLGMAAPKRAM